MTDFYQKCKDDWSKRLEFSVKGAGKIEYPHAKSRLASITLSLIQLWTQNGSQI